MAYNMLVNFTTRSMAEYAVARLERLSKILIPYGNIDRPDKLHKLYSCWQVERPSKFFTVNCMPNAIYGKRKADTAYSACGVGRKAEASIRTQKIPQDVI